jgi:MFS family permease
MLIGLLWHGTVLASGTVSFHSDEAVVGLMARHINQGKPIPTFFYGQDYMGSLDPLLVSLAFRLFGESVLSIRLVQFALYLLFVATTMLLALRLSDKRTVALLAGLIVALPPTLVSVYTTISLGGYGETLVLGNLLLLVGYGINTRKIQSWRYWLGFGALAGLGWWTNNLVVFYILPIAILFLRSWRSMRWQMLLLSLIAFFAFSAPWWLYNLSHHWSSIQFLLKGFEASGATVQVGPIDRFLGLLFFGLPAVIGVRYPWTPTLWAGVLAIPVIFLYAVLLVIAARRRPVKLGAELMWFMLIGIVVVFVASRFGVDATGRYLLPMLVPLSILIAMQLSTLPRAWMLGLTIILVSVNTVGTILAMRTVPPGLTPQFAAETDFPNEYDQQVIDFLKAQGGQRGYATYWAAYRLIFLSQEQVILSPQLPFLSSLLKTSNDRYPDYTALVNSTDRPVYVTANLPTLDSSIAERLTRRGITFSRQAIGPYTIFYDLSARVTPAELGLHDLGE